MQLWTLKRAREDEGLITVTGKCGDTSEFLRYLNSGIQRLLYRGDWYQTLFIGEVCVNDNCIVWPRQFGKIRAIKICQQDIPVQSWWSGFRAFSPDYCSFRDWFRSDYKVEQRGTVPIFKQIPCGAENWYVRLYIERQADIGKTCTIYGVDTHGQILRSVKTDGVYSEGVTIVAGVPFGSTSIPIRSITRVFFNEDFVGNSRLYGYDADNDVLHNIGLYEPGETEPAYVYSRILPDGCCGRRGNNNCNGVRAVTALAKINPDPLRLDTDLLQIQNLEAVKIAVQAIRKEEAGDLGAYRERLNAAVEEMNHYEEDWVPEEQIPIEVYPFGGAYPRFHKVGYVN